MSISIEKIEVRGKRLALLVKFDISGRFWYITTTDRTKNEIIEILKQLYNATKESQTKSYKTKIEKLKKELEGLNIKV